MSTKKQHRTFPWLRQSAGRAKLATATGLIGVALTLAACSSSGTAATSTSPGSASGGSGGPVNSITIMNFAFSPNRIAVRPGASVIVTNRDQVAHTVTASNGGFSTGDIAAGQSKSFTAPNTPGTYAYICSIHQYMSGTLVVSG